MWSQFIASSAFEAIFLFVPGYLLARALRLARPLALGTAPAISCALLEIWALIAWKAGIWADWAVVGIPVLALALAAFIASEVAARALDKGGMRIGGNCLPERRTLAVSLAAFAGAGIVICTIIFVKHLDGPTSFFQACDNLSHMLRIRTFVDTGTFSPIGIDMHYNLENPPFDEGLSGFYPSSWHCLAALSVSAFDAPVALSINATNTLFMALAAPISAWTALCVLLPKRAFTPCAILPLAFAAFPWGMITFGPLYPNMAAFAMVFGTAACYMAIFKNRMDKGSTALAGTAFIACLMGLGLSHPNAVFTLAVILVPYTCAQTLDLPCFTYEDGSKSKLRFAACAGFFAIAVGAWILALNMPFFASVVNHTWPSFVSSRQALLKLLTLALRDGPAQYLLALLVVAGAASTLKQRRHRWMIASLAIASVMYLVNAFSDGLIKMWLTGFWYQDSYRICGVVSLAALPLACFGLLAITDAIKTRITSQRNPGEHARAHTRRSTGARALNMPTVASGILTLAVALILFHSTYHLPEGRTINTAFGYTRNLINFQNDTCRKDNVLGIEERAFLDKVSDIVEPDTVILNHPFDGSSFAAANWELNVYWRFWSGYDIPEDNQTSQTLRFGANKMAENENVARALRESGAQYLLLLDQGTLPEEDYMRHTIFYNSEEWAGIEAINDQTPGLELLLGEGDMRLYRITATEGE